MAGTQGSITIPDVCCIKGHFIRTVNSRFEHILEAAGAVLQQIYAYHGRCFVCVLGWRDREGLLITKTWFYLCL